MYYKNSSWRPIAIIIKSFVASFVKSETLFNADEIINPVLKLCEIVSRTGTTGKTCSTDPNDGGCSSPVPAKAARVEESQKSGRCLPFTELKLGGTPRNSPNADSRETDHGQTKLGVFSQS